MKRSQRKSAIRLAGLCIMAAGLILPANGPGVAAMGGGDSSSGTTTTSPPDGSGTKDDDKKKHHEDASWGSAPPSSVIATDGYIEAVLFLKQGEYRSAIDALNALNAPDDPEVLNLLGYAHRKLGMVDQGIAFYLKALERYPQYTRVHEYLGEAYLQQDDIERARATLAKLRQLCGEECREYRELSAAIASYMNDRG